MCVCVWAHLWEYDGGCCCCSWAAIFLPWQRLHLPQSHLLPPESLEHSARRVHLDVTSTQLMPCWRCNHTLTHMYTVSLTLSLSKHTQGSSPIRKHTLNYCYTIFALSLTHAHTQSVCVSKQWPSLYSAWLISLCNHQRCALWECLLGQKDATGAEGFTRLWKTAEGGGRGGEKGRDIQRGPVTGNERWHFKEEAEFHLQLPQLRGTWLG